MRTTKPPNHTAASALNRREFLAGTVTGASLLAAGRHGHAADGALNTDPGFIGPPFFDEAERAALMDVRESGSPFRYWGPGRPVKVQALRGGLCPHMGARFALGVTSGTAALDCAVAGLGIGPGDEVIVPAYTWWSDYTCVVHAGALPVFAEDRPHAQSGSRRILRESITPRTKAVIAVHLLGGPCDLEPILEVARRRSWR